MEDDSAAAAAPEEGSQEPKIKRYTLQMSFQQLHPIHLHIRNQVCKGYQVLALMTVGLAVCFYALTSC